MKREEKRTEEKIREEKRREEKIGTTTLQASRGMPASRLRDLEQQGGSGAQSSADAWSGAQASAQARTPPHTLSAEDWEEL